MNLTRDDGIESTLQDIKDDVAAARSWRSQYDFCFTYITVGSLIDKIEELQARIDNGKGCRLVNDGALQMVRNALVTDGEVREIRREMLAELDKATKIL